MLLCPITEFHSVYTRPFLSRDLAKTSITRTHATFTISPLIPKSIWTQIDEADPEKLDTLQRPACEYRKHLRILEPNCKAPICNSLESYHDVLWYILQCSKSCSTMVEHSDSLKANKIVRSRECLIWWCMDKCWLLYLKTACSSFTENSGSFDC